ncbi:MAG: hypothetical protein OXG35_30660 [Acidobacteria bacterium]|nr:hypothetical protein [Acidobacteriota bacterium]
MTSSRYDHCPGRGHETKRPAGPAGANTPRICTVCWKRDPKLRAYAPNGGTPRRKPA